jgi:hypothetical protein
MFTERGPSWPPQEGVETMHPAIFKVLLGRSYDLRAGSVILLERFGKRQAKAA